MSEEIRPDLTCVPYRRKGLYFTLTIPMILAFVVVLAYLGTYHPILAFIFFSLYLMTCIFQAYCCAYQECPYIGKFCPAVAGITPSNLIAKFLYGSGLMNKSKRLFETHALIASATLFGMMIFPIYWIAKIGIGWTVAYIVFVIVYLLTFTLTICPVCAIRGSCPAGKIHNLFYNQ